MDLQSLPCTPSNISSLFQCMLANEEKGRKVAMNYMVAYLLPETRDLFINNIIYLLFHSKENEVRTFCCIVLRKNLTTGEPVVLFELEETTQLNIKTELLNLVMIEKENSIRRQLCDVIAELSPLFVFSEENGNGWVELYNCITYLLNSKTNQHVETGLLLYNNICKISPAVLENHYENIINQLKLVLVNSEIKIKQLALQTTCTIISSIGEEDKQMLFCELLNSFPSIITDLVNAKIDIEKDIQAITSVAYNADTKFLKVHFNTFIPMMIQTANVSTDICKHSLDFLTICAEKASGLVRKNKDFADTVFEMALSLVLQLEEDDTWDVTEEPATGVYEDSCFDYGLDCISRLSKALGAKGRTLLFSKANTYLNNTSWLHRHAGLWALSQMAEFVTTKEVDKIVEIAIAFIRDPHSRVRYAAINVLGQCASDFAPTFQIDFHSVVVPALLERLDDPSPRVQAHSAAGLINFCEHSSKEDLKDYMNPLLHKLYLLLQNSMRFVQTQIVTAIAMVAESSKEEFVNFYGHFMPLLKEIITKANGKEDRFFRCRAIECFTLIGMAVTADVYLSDAQDCMNVLYQIYMDPSTAEDDDPTRGYIISAWGRIAAVLKSQFFPYLEQIIPIAFTMAKLDPKLTYQDNKGENVDVDDPENDVTAGRMDIKTSVLSDKSSAVNLLCALATEMGESYFPFVAPTMEVLLPCISYVYSEEVRSYSISAMPALLQCSVKAFKNGHCDNLFIRQLFEAMTKEIVASFPIEEDGDILTTMVHALAMIIEECDEVIDQILTPDQLEIVGKSCFKLLVESQVRLERRESEKKGPDFDEDAEDELDMMNESEFELNTQICTTLTALAKSQREKFLPVIDIIYPEVHKFLESNLEELQKVGLYITVDIFEFCGAGGIKYFQTILPFFLKISASENVVVRQPACYGLGICGRFLPSEVIAPYINQMLQALFNVVGRSDSREETSVLCTDNAIASISKIIYHHQHLINANEILPLWFNSLPIVEDYTEATYPFMLLCELFEKNHPIIQNVSWLPKLFFLAAEYYKTDFLTPEIVTRIASVCRNILTNLPANNQAELINTLSDTNKAKLQELIQTR